MGLKFYYGDKVRVIQRRDNCPPGIEGVVYASKDDKKHKCSVGGKYEVIVKIAISEMKGHTFNLHGVNILDAHKPANRTTKYGYYFFARKDLYRMSSNSPSADEEL